MSVRIESVSSMTMTFIPNDVKSYGRGMLSIPVLLVGSSLGDIFWYDYMQWSDLCTSLVGSNLLKKYMQFIFSSLVLLVFDGILLLYLINSEYFSPRTISDEVDIWNVMLFVVMVSLGTGLIVSLLVYFSEKILYCGKREFPPISRSVKFGSITSLIFLVGLILHVFHFLNPFLIIVLCALVLIGIIITR